MIKNFTPILTALLTLLVIETAPAQFAKKFSATNFVPTTVQRGLLLRARAIIRRPGNRSDRGRSLRLRE